MAKFRVSRNEPLPEVTFLQFLAATGLNIAQVSDYYGWSYDTIRRWSSRQGPPNLRDRQLLASRLEIDLPAIKAMLSELNK